MKENKAKNMFKTKNKSESGRSMVETLGTLAIMGVLSVVGVAGIRLALESHKVSTIIEALNSRVTVLAADKMFAKGFTPDNSFGNDTNYVITCNDLSNTDFFSCTVQGVPQAICQKILESKWSVPAGIMPTECAIVNDMVFSFSKNLDGRKSSCITSSDCPTALATCTGGFCVEPEEKTCTSSTNGQNPCGDACQLCNASSLKCENVCTKKEYLQSSGLEYIDTGIAPTNTTGAMLVGSVLSVENSNGTLCGSRVSGGNRFFFSNFQKSNNSFGIGWNSYHSNLVKNASLGTVYTHEFNYKNSRQYVCNGVVYYSITETLGTIGFTIYLFASHASNTINDINSARIYKAKITEGDVLVRDFVPVRYNPTNEACMYDKVSKELFCNQGSGVFTTD